MELILLPFVIVVQFMTYLLMAIVGLIFNFLFRSDRNKFLGENGSEEIALKPKNPWEVFAFSVVATIILATICAGLAFYIWGTSRAAMIGFIVMGILEIFSSITAATGKPPPI